MKITREEVLKIARLARLDLEEKEVEGLTKNLDDIRQYVEQLDSLDTKGVEPTAHLAVRATPLRDDVVRDSLPAEEALANAPKQGGGGFLVPKVVDVT